MAPQPETNPVGPGTPARSGDASARALGGHLLHGVGLGPLVFLGLLVGLLLLPVFAILALAMGPVAAGGGAALPTLNLGRTLKETALLLVGVGTVSLAVGTGAAWLVTMYRFPGRSLIDRLLVLPFAIPTYIVAYAYVELLDYAGPVQSMLRNLGGWTSAREYWFPDVRSLPGGILILSTVLYPYVYLTARASFVQQSVCVLEVARTLGCTSIGAFTAVALPLSRPALAAGVSLVLMEVLNDLGATQYLGIETLSVSIYATWLQRGSLSGAAQIASFALVGVLALLLAERFARMGALVHHTTGRYRSIPFQDLPGFRGMFALALCALPVLLGFVVPVALLGHRAITHIDGLWEAGLARAIMNSIVLSLLAAGACAAVALALAYARRVVRSPVMGTIGTVASLGYALPGTILALGLMYALAGFDNRIDQLARTWFGLSTGLLVTGGLTVLILAYVIRFLSVSTASIDAGLEKLSPNLDAAARALGETSWSALWRVHVPLLIPALGASALLVFVDCMKELPATLLLRPLDFETLATHVYAKAALEQFEAASIGALVIVAVGLIPVLLLHRTVAAGRI
jgi:iron(III) transport system permease protein